MTRDDLKTFRGLDIHFDSICLDWGGEFTPYFCTPAGAEEVGSLSYGGVHFVLLPGDERVFCVDPSMGDIGTYVLPVANDFREFLSFVLYCRDANPLSMIYQVTEDGFRKFAADEARLRMDPEWKDFFKTKDAALSVIAETFAVTPAEPYHKVKAMQAAFDPGAVQFTDEYYDMMGLENPRHPGEETVTQGTAFAAVTFTAGEESALPQDPDILLSYVNMKLRDEYDSLDALCGGLDVIPAELTEKLAGLGWAYDAGSNQFRPV